MNSNETTKRLSYSDYCKNFIIDHLENFEGNKVYSCDLGSELTQGINVNGSATYSTYEAKEYLREWWDEAGEYWEYEKDNFGENIHNPFDAPEAYMACMIIEGVRSILAQVELIDKKWNDEITLTKKNIKTILSAVNDLEVNI